MKMLSSFLIVFCLICSFTAAKNAWKAEEETAKYWKNLGKQELDRALKLQKHNMEVARNVIILLGDGMGIPTITAGRILKGQMRGHSGEETVLAMDKFPNVGLSKTYAVNKQVADSASTATAYLCGVKSNYDTIGLTAAARKNNCSSQKGAEVDSILIDAYNAGKSTGIVTTTRINHATPAGAYAHSAMRDWYCDVDLTDQDKADGCVDIAQQFVDNADKITVALGGGRQYFQPSSTYDPEYPTSKNIREDGQDLIAKWLENHASKNLNASYVWNQAAFDNVDLANTDRLLGIFEPKGMNYESDRKTDKAGEPSLAEMTEKAIRMLQKNPKGFFLLIEGGRIDHGHHNNNAYKALHDFVAFDNAVAKAVEMTSDGDTMIIVTADHSHTFNFGGYTDRGNPIFGLAVSEGKLKLGLDGKPYTSLLYGNGKAYQGPDVNPSEPHIRQNLTGILTDKKSYLQQSAVPLKSESHGGEDVAIMARGPMSHLIHGVHQQSYIAYVMRYASCLGNDQRHCEGGSNIGSAPKDVEISIFFIGTAMKPETARIALTVMFAFLIILTVVIACSICYYVYWKTKCCRGEVAYTSGDRSSASYNKTDV